MITLFFWLGVVALGYYLLMLLLAVGLAVLRGSWSDALLGLYWPGAIVLAIVSGYRCEWRSRRQRRINAATAAECLKPRR